MNKPKPSIQQKVQKDFPEFADEVAGLSVEQLDARISETAKAAEEIQTSKESDEGLEEAKASVSELNAPYKEALKVTRLKIKYLIALIKEKGGK